MSMDNDDIDAAPLRRDIKKGRRAGRTGLEDGNLFRDESFVGDNKTTPNGTPPKPSRRQAGWSDDTSKTSGDRRLRLSVTPEKEDSDNDIPIIPDLEDTQEEDISNQVAQAPNVAVNRVATYRELDNDLLKHSALATLDNDIDLKILMKCLTPESEIIEPDVPWEWERLFTEVSSELQCEWEKGKSEEEIPS